MTAEDRGARRSTADLIGAVVWTILKIGFVLGILAVLGLIGLGIWFQQQFPEPKGIPAPIAWTTQEVVLSAESRVLEGRLTLTTRPGGSGVRTVGVNVGVPTRQPGGLPVEPGDIISSPAARLTATSVGQSNPSRSCLAPCELEVPVSFACTATGCEMVVDITVELLVRVGGADPDVTVGIAGGLTASAESRVLEGLVVDLAIEGSTAPEPT
jgi:hypothetical protein